MCDIVHRVRDRVCVYMCLYIIYNQELTSSRTKGECENDKEDERGAKERKRGREGGGREREGGREKERKREREMCTIP